MGLELVAPIVVAFCGLINVILACYDLYLLFFYLLTRHRKVIGGKLPQSLLIDQDFEGGKSNDDADLPPRPTEDGTALQQKSCWRPDPTIDYPHVTIQLPAYNELTCLESLLHAMSRIQWPRDRLQIQLLDDSTLPEAVDLAKSIIQKLKVEKGVIIEHKTRPSRIGYKAGNLLHHFDSIRGDFVAIFDADFLPSADFLLQTIPYFYDAQGSRCTHISLVQTTWVHYNQTDNLFTHVQGLLQNLYFIFQQNVRCRVFESMSFNGTAGIWSKDAIRASGNWNYDTVTEDLDIACRAKVNGYRFVYLEHVTVPSEVPPTMMAYKRQQRRWTQGHIQVGRKIIRAVWMSKRFSFIQKVDISHMIFNKLNWVPTSIVTFFVPLLGFAWSKNSNTPLFIWLILAFSTLFVAIAWLAIFVVVLYDTKFINPDMSVWQRIRRIYVLVPFAYFLSLGMSFWQCVSVFEGFILNDIPFATTPKSGFMLESSRHEALDDEKIQVMARMARIDDLDQDNLDKEQDKWSKTSVKDMHYDGWDQAAVQGETTRFIIRRKPKLLSKTFPKWSHFVELILACYWLFIPMLYDDNFVFGIPIMISSVGFWWVAIPGVRTTMASWWWTTKMEQPHQTTIIPYCKQNARSHQVVCEEKKDDEADEMGETEASSLLLHSKSCASTVPVYWSVSDPNLPIIV